MNANQDFPHAGSLHYRVMKRDGAYYPEHDGKVLPEADCMEAFAAPNTDRVIIYLNELINHHVMLRFPGLLRIHAGCAAFGDKRFIVVGDKGAGKTTLMCKLLFSGAMVYSDEYVLLEDSQVIPFPRKFHLKPGTVKLVPELSDASQHLVPYRSALGERFNYFDPTCAGFDWTISKKRLDAVFFLEPDHSGPSRVTVIPKWEMIKKVMLQIDNFSPDPRLEIRDLCLTINETDCYNLYLGDLEGAVRIIRESIGP